SGPGSGSSSSRPRSIRSPIRRSRCAGERWHGDRRRWGELRAAAKIAKVAQRTRRRPPLHPSRLLGVLCGPSERVGMTWIDEGPLARGAMAEVRAVRRGDELGARKQIRADQVGNPVYRALLDLEGEALQRLSSVDPVVRLLDRGPGWLVLE